MSNSILGKGKYVENMSHFIKWLKICPILLLVENMSILFFGLKSVRRKSVRRKSVRRKKCPGAILRRTRNYIFSRISLSYKIWNWIILALTMALLSRSTHIYPQALR